MSLKTVKWLFGVAAGYDIILGAIFGFCFRPIYSHFGTALPNHAGYLQLAAAYILIFGIGFWFVSRRPQAHRGIITLGILMKAAFVVIVFGHLLLDTIPSFYVPFAVIDFVFLVLFFPAQAAVKRAAG